MVCCRYILKLSWVVKLCMHSLLKENDGNSESFPLGNGRKLGVHLVRKLNFCVVQNASPEYLRELCRMDFSMSCELC